MPDAEVSTPLGGNTPAKSKKKNNSNNKKKKQIDNSDLPNGENSHINTATVKQQDTENEQSEPPTPVDDKSANGSIHKSKDESGDLAQKLDVVAKERDKLLQEVAECRKSLEEIQEKHKQDVQGLEEKAKTAEEEKEEAELRYNDLRDRVTDIRATLGERLKSNAAEIAEANTRIEELEENSKTLEEGNSELASTVAKLRSQHEKQAKEIDTLRNRGNLSQANWIKERDELIRLEALAREEYETSKQAMQDWEVLAMEERSMRENLRDKVAELETQLANIQDSYEKSSSERDSLSQTVDGLQRALRDIQEERKRELRELVESHKTQVEEYQKQQQTAEDTALVAKAEADGTKKELERVLHFEKEVKEKNLQIGKLRHEGVIMNDHLIKALKFIKRQNPDDQVDRQVVTNHFLRFLTLDRSDPKKFQVLQVISHLLNWSDEQKEQAGLARPGAVPAPPSAVRLPLTPLFRSASSSSSAAVQHAVGAELGADHHRAGAKDSLAELWSDFLQREAADGMTLNTPGLGGSRRPSSSSLANGGSDSGLVSPMGEKP